MSAMKPTTSSQPAISRSMRTNTIESDKPEKAYGDRHFKPVVTPGLFKGPILPIWLSKRLRRKETSAQ
jgi:hypothetical protein